MSACVLVLLLAACGGSGDADRPGTSGPPVDDPAGGTGRGDDAGDGPEAGPEAGPDGPSAPILPEPASGLPAAVERRLERVIALYNGDPIETAAALAERFDAPGSGTAETGRTPAASRYADGSAARVEYACGGGGTAGSAEETAPGGELRERDVTFDGCRVGDLEASGDVRVVRPDRGAIGTPPAPYTRTTLPSIYQSIDLRVTDRRTNRETVLTNASAAATPPDPAVGGPRLTVAWRAVAAPIEITDAQGTTSVRDLSTGVVWLDADPGAGEVRESGLDARLSGDGADSITGFATREAFVRDASDAHFTAGVLEVSGEGFGYVLDAANGDPDSFQLVVVEGDATSSFTVPWLARFELDAFEPFSVDLGF